MTILQIIEYNHTKADNDVITTSEIQELLQDEHNIDRAKPTISEHLSALKDEGLIAKVGHDRSGVYEYTGPLFE